MHLRVLVVESDPEDLLFLEDVLTEIEERRHWRQWADVECLVASTCMEVASILPGEPVDIILLNPNLSDIQGAATFRRVQTLGPQTPGLLLIASEERRLVAQLVREGGQELGITKQ